ncbi:MAG: MBL fold metallo-hydrolase [Phycisphaeraceae bacterium]|nr:MBL fold metallo-hydrolase [Phycisphaerales bacterium]MCB9861211.1 MBL fold metallo-hydrolase [Phycisphaeraceae bacterium]
MSTHEIDQADVVFHSDQVTIFRFTLGPFETNCYVVAQNAGDTRHCSIIDASFEPGTMIDFVRLQGFTPDELILTHAHIDHIAGVRDVRAAFANTPILIHTDERDWLTDPQLNMSASYGLPVTTPSADRLLNHNDTLDIAGLTWDVRHTPGHSPGSVSLYNKDTGVCIAGDALFAGSIGRTDFPSSNHNDLIDAITRELYTLPDDTLVLPGHGPETTIGTEKHTNPFVRA